MMEKYPVTNKLFYIPLVFFVLSAGLGLLMRYSQVYGLAFPGFQNLLQAHSHVTFLGWGFLAILLLIHRYFEIPFDKKYQILWGTMTLSIVGLLIFFPIYGYKLIPILFLIIFLLASYVYLSHLLKVIKVQTAIENRFIRIGVYYYFISSLAVWFVPVALLKYGKEIIYFDLIYFYLHFLYNGFFVFVLSGLFIKSVLRDQPDFRFQGLKKFLVLLNIAVIPTYFLSLYWHTTNPFVVVIGATGALIQMIGLVYFWQNILTSKPLLFRSRLIFIIAVIFTIKILLQFLSAHPNLAQQAISLKPFFVVMYLHLFTIGFLSLSVFWLMKLKKSGINNLALQLFIFGFVLTEMLLFYQGSAIWFNLTPLKYFYNLVFWGSFSMFIGVMLILMGTRIKSKSEV